MKNIIKIPITRMNKKKWEKFFKHYPNPKDREVIMNYIVIKALSEVAFDYWVETTDLGKKYYPKYALLLKKRKRKDEDWR